MSNIKLFKSYPVVTLEMYSAILNFENQEVKEHKFSSSLSQSYQHSIAVKNKAALLKECISRSVFVRADRLAHGVGNKIACLSANATHTHREPKQCLQADFSGNL